MSPRPVNPDSFRIVVLDDNPGSRLLIERILHRHFGCHVRAVGTIAELRLACEEEVPDLFLLDIVLDNETGIDACRGLKQQAATHDIPVIFFSEHGQPQTRLEALRSGGIDYVDKPFYPEEFLQRIRSCVERFRHQKQLESQTAEQEALLRVLCHDLRNSVGACQSFLQLHATSRDENERRGYVDLGLKATHSALDLISHVGEYRSLLDENRPLKLEPVPVAEAAAESLRLLRPFASAKGVRLLSDIPPGLELLTNRVVLVHNILNNLLNNAVKFSRPGDEVRLEARTVPGAHGPECLLSVRDNGIGIPPAILATLLQCQPVTSRPGTADEPGTGMGITLVSLYVKRCGGLVSITSQVHQPEDPSVRSGTCVELRFPLPVAATSQVAPTHEVAPAAEVAA
jgi:two-component system sensor histidine kinase/response regulator